MIELVALSLGLPVDIFGLGLASSFMAFHFSFGRKLLKHGYEGEKK